MREPALEGLPELRQIVNVIYVQQVPLVEVGTGPARPDVRRIPKRSVGPVRGIVQRMAVGIRNSNGHRPPGAAKRGLQSVILRIGDVLQTQNPVESEVRAQRVWVRNALVYLSVQGVVGSVTRRYQVRPRRLGVVDGKSVDHKVGLLRIAAAAVVARQAVGNRNGLSFVVA